MNTPFNQLTEAQVERLAVLAEEAGEIVQAVGKILRHGYSNSHPDGGSSNRTILTQELGDLSVAMALLIEAGDLDGDAVSLAAKAKAARIGRFLHAQSGAWGSP